MSNELRTLFQDIADAIKDKTGSTDTMKPAEFPSKIRSIESGGGGLDISDESLQYFTYQIGEGNSIILRTILYDEIYADTKSYAVSIPDTLGGYGVVIDSR